MGLGPEANGYQGSVEADNPDQTSVILTNEEAGVSCSIINIVPGFLAVRVYIEVDYPVASQEAEHDKEG